MHVACSRDISERIIAGGYLCVEEGKLERYLNVGRVKVIIALMNKSLEWLAVITQVLFCASFILVYIYDKVAIR